VNPVKLGQLRAGQKGRIVAVGTSSDSADWVQRLMAMGFLEGSVAEVVHEAPFGGDPVAIRVRGTLLALRRQEANAIEVVQYE